MHPWWNGGETMAKGGADNIEHVEGSDGMENGPSDAPAEHVKGSDGMKNGPNDAPAELTLVPFAPDAQDQLQANASEVTMFKNEHTCTSSMRTKTTTPTCSWIASKAVPILAKTPNMGAKEIQIKLQDNHKCTIHDDTVWRGKEKALKQLYGS